MTMSLPSIHARADWAGPLSPRAEPQREDTRFLLVHHTATGNEYSADEVPEMLRRSYAEHTSKGWPDVAYNFLVDRYGGCWEGRAGSIDGPVVANATGGNQGFSQLVCVIGNYQEAPPTEASIDTLVATLAWLADRDGVDPTPGATVQFVSRGSNRWPPGTTVTARTIAGHREMSQTVCPGDYLFRRLETDVPARVAAVVAAAVVPTTTVPPTTTSPPTTIPATTSPAPDTESIAVGPGATADGEDSDAWWPVGVGVTAIAGATAWVIRRRMRLERRS
jgi:hypothetical protein